MNDFREQFPILIIIGLVMISVYPILLIEVMLANTLMFPYFAAIVEELAKASIILYFIIKFKPDAKHALLYGVAAGAAFGFIENLMYAVRFIPRPDFSVIIFHRFFQPFVIHILASSLFALLAKKKMPVIGVLAAIILHALYNFILLS